jgi:hypothetical protein
MKTNLSKIQGRYVVITTLSVTVITVAVLVPSYRHQSKNSTSVTHPSVAVTDLAKAYTATSAVKHRIKPPLKDVDVPYKSFHYKAEKGATLTYGNSHVRIPENSLVDKTGKLVKGDVNIQYREFHTPLDFFVSGIPMTYDSGGQQYTFESDGMFDIKGYHNGEEVYVKPGKQLSMDISSMKGTANYNFYRFDTASGQWTLLEPHVTTTSVTQTNITTDTVSTKVVAMKEDISKIQQDEKKLEDDAPFIPQKAGAAKCYVSIDADTNQYPELTMYQGIWFAVDPKDTQFSLRYTANYRVWQNMTFKRIDKGQTYQATVSSGNEAHTFILHPVFEGTAYETAIATYNKKFKQYEVMMNEKKEEERKKEEAYQALLAQQEAQRVKEEEERKQQQQAQFNHDLKKDLNSAVTYYCLNIKSFGTYNCDNPNNRPQGAALAANYTDNKNENLNNQTVYLVEKGKNMLNTYGTGQPFCFNPASVNFAWCVTPDNRLAVFTDDNFKKINQTDGSYTMVLSKTNKTFKSEAELDSFFKQYM